MARFRQPKFPNFRPNSITLPIILIKSCHRVGRIEKNIYSPESISLCKRQKIITLFISIIQSKMNINQYQIESLLDSNEEDNKPPEPAKPKYYKTKPKNFDLYDSLISTYLISELCGQDVLDDQSCEIDVLEYEAPSNKRKRGRPKKQQKREDDYEAENDEEYDEGGSLSRNRKKRKKRLVKGDTKNIFNFFHRVVLQYLQKHFPAQQFLEIRNIQSNRYLFFTLLKNQKYDEILREMFETRYLNREVILSNRLNADRKIIYLKKIQIFKDVFFSSEQIFNIKA